MANYIYGINKNKKWYFLIAFICFTYCYSQNNNIHKYKNSNYLFSKYEILDSDKKGEKIKQFLNETDDSLIISFENGKYISLKNNEINCYTVCNDNIINQIKWKDSIDIINFKISIDTLLCIDPKKITNEIDKDGNTISVQDGVEHRISFYQDNKSLTLFSYSPETYMDDKFPFAQVRKKFLKNWLNLDKYFYDKEFNRLKSLDTIYLFIERGKNLEYVVNINKSKNIRQENYFFNLNCSEGQFTNINNQSLIEPANTHYEDISFLNTNSNKIINLEYLKRFTSCDLNQIIESNVKKIFIIDKFEIMNNRIKIKEVRGGTYCF